MKLKFDKCVKDRTAEENKDCKKQSLKKYLNTDKGKMAKRKALQTYYYKNKQKIIERNKKYYAEKYSKVIKEKKGTKDKKGANYKVVDGDKVFTAKKGQKYTTKLKPQINSNEQSKHLFIKDGNVVELNGNDIEQLKEEGSFNEYSFYVDFS
tara:strand:+ start:359 stop:814 length:456 start_codon:yes stop_codon:yes gene_type:complete